MMLLMLTLVLANVLLIEIANAHLNLNWDAKNPALDPDIYIDALDPEVCQKQLRHIGRNALLRLQFLEAGLKFPRAILMGNTLDMGNYYQCLGIKEDIEDSTIEGKYCMIQGPLSQDNYEILANQLDWPEYNKDFHVIKKLLKPGQDFNKMKPVVALAGISFNDNSRSFPGSPFEESIFKLAVCVPKTCTTQEGIRGLLFNTTALGFQYEEEFCRFSNDKPWAPADYVAIAVFSFIGFLTLLSTGYDLRHKYVLKKDPKTADTVYKSFSVYSNARRLTTFSSNPDKLECVDGIRSLAIMWIIVGHTYNTLPPTYNNLYGWEWIFDIRSLWITAAPYTVDTFFMLSGTFLVYTTAGKMTGMKLLKNLHLFYLNRLLRMFPLLATAVLLQASVLNRITDGPIWTTVATLTDNCRTYWWATFLYIQNFLNVEDMCISHSWYLSIDMHCYIVSPLILYWLLNDKKRPAWIALTLGLVTSLTIAAVYCFIMQFQGWTFAPSRSEDPELNYMIYYYFNTVPRAPPFFVGMLFGYLLHLWRRKKITMSVCTAVFGWVCCLTTTSTLVYVTHLMKDFDAWVYWTLDDLINSFGRSIWAVAVGWIIVSCHHGYGGPINWFLSLRVWKLPSRISYGMYLFHYPIMYTISGTALAPMYFSDSRTLYEFLKHLVIAFCVSFFLTLLIDSPCSTLVKLLLGGGRLQESPERAVSSTEPIVGDVSPQVTGPSAGDGRQSVRGTDNHEFEIIPLKAESSTLEA